MWQTKQMIALMTFVNVVNSLMNERPSNDKSKHIQLVTHEAVNSSVLEACPRKNFQAALDWILHKKLLDKDDATSLAETQYLKNSKNHCNSGPDWKLSEKPLIINVGEGTTGTRWLDEIMQDLGYKGGHHIKNLCRGTEIADKYDYISDSPVSSFAWQLLQSHPKAVFIMTLRDPVAWQTSRLGHHPRSHQFSYRVPCGTSWSGHDLSSKLAPANYVAYAAWLKCILPAHRLFVANLFTEHHDDAKLIDDLISFLEAHSLQTESWERRIREVRHKVLMQTETHVMEEASYESESSMYGEACSYPQRVAT